MGAMNKPARKHHLTEWAIEEGSGDSFAHCTACGVSARKLKGETTTKYLRARTAGWIKSFPCAGNRS